jgi:outer membrane receptor for ferrienterochelin and colicins
MRCTAVLLGLIALPAVATSQGGVVRGTVTELAGGAPLGGSTVSALAGTELVGSATTDRNGMYRLSGLQNAPHVLLVRRAGYRNANASSVMPSDSGTTVDFRLERLPQTLDPIVISATMSRESKFDSPVSTSIVRREDLQDAQAVTALDYVRYVPGVDYASKGVATQTFSARGPRGVSASSMLLLSDFRFAAVPYLGLNVGLLLPSTNEDIERIEIVRGPGAVLYGPNSRRGVVHVIKRSPLEPGESMVSIAGGSMTYTDAAFRVSHPAGQIGLKVSGRYLSGHDWAFVDDVEQRLRSQAIAAGARADTLLIGRREKDFESLQGDARVDWRLGENTLVATTLGFTEATGIETGAEAGAAQAKDWVYAYAQTRLEHRSWFANFSYNWGDAGDSYGLRNGAVLTNKSRLVSGQVKHERLFARSLLQYGVDLQWTIPRTDGTLNGRFEDDDGVTETGMYAHLTTALSPKVDLLAALRLDHHNRLEKAWFLSPRAGIVFKPSPTQSVRATYSRTFEQPAARLMFADFSLGPLGPLPFNIQLHGLGGSGLNVLRDCGGPCMRVPTAFGGTPGAAAPAEATRMWPVIVGILRAQGIDISMIPAPTPAQVATLFGALNFASGSFDAVSAAQLRDVAPMRRSEERVIEVGYKTVLANMSLGVDAYHTWADHVFASGAAVLTPNVFFDPASLARYLGGFMPAAQAQQLAGGIAQIPVGTIATDRSSGADILVAPFGNQGGSFSYAGVDVGVDAQLTPRVSGSASYSWVSRDSVSLGVADAFLLFNVPRNKAAIGVKFRDDQRGLTVDLRGRALGSFSVNTPAYIGVVDSYTAVDATLAVRLPSATHLTLVLDVSNVFNDVHHEMTGSAKLGRFFVTRLNARF